MELSLSRFFCGKFKKWYIDIIISKLYNQLYR